MAAEANLDESMCKMCGDELDDRFDITFLGGHETAASRCAQFYDSLFLGRGKWKKQSCPNALGVETTFFCNPDKNGAQIRKEVLSKHLLAHLKEVIKDATPFRRKETGTILVNRRKLVSVIIADENRVDLDWDEAKAHALQVDIPAAELWFKNLVNDGGKPSS